MVKRNRGFVFFLIGCILLFVAGGWYIYNVLEDKNAGKQAEKILDGFENNEDAPVIIVEGDAFCGRIIIDKLEMELPIYDEWDYKRLKSAPCRYTGGVNTDDIIIAGHNYKTIFGSLGKLVNGDEIKFIDGYGEEHIYEVYDVVILDGTAVSDMQSGEWDLTLFTCTKSGEQRVTVRCERK